VPESVIIYPKQDKLLDTSIKQKAYSFLEKLAQDDSAPGLHIEPVHNAADSRARTGRVDQQYRALLFKLTTPTSTAYVVHGIYNHDDAYTMAAKVQLTIKRTQGLAVGASQPRGVVEAKELRRGGSGVLSICPRQPEAPTGETVRVRTSASAE